MNEMKRCEFENDLKKIYQTINKQYKSITRELVDSIIRKFDDIADVFINNSTIISSRGKDSLDENLLTRKILNHEGRNEANTISTVINFILNMFIFMNVYESKQPEKLFNGFAYYDWMITQIRVATLAGVKNNPSFNDDNIMKVFDRFINITDDEIYQLVKKAEMNVD